MTIPFLILVNVIFLLMLLISFNRLPPELPLFYSRAKGESQITVWWMILLIPFLMNTLFVVNRFISKKFFSTIPFIVRFIDVFNMAIVVVFAAIFLKIVSLIT